MLALLLPASFAHAHQEGALFSDAIIDPLVIHHAHIESEERINFSTMNGVRGVDVPGRPGYKAELELAYAIPSYRYGFEIFIPIANLPAPEGNGRVSGPGDIAVRPLKYALYMIQDFVLSTATEFLLPTGARQKGLGEGRSAFEQLVFMDKAQGNWNLGVNLGLGSSIDRERTVPLHYGAVLAYSFIGSTKIEEIAHVPESQSWVPSLSVEFVGENILHGQAAGRTMTSLIPGLTLWHVHSGWQMRLGLEVPTGGTNEAASVVLFQIGNHLKWL